MAQSANTYKYTLIIDDGGGVIMRDTLLGLVIEVLKLRFKKKGR